MKNAKDNVFSSRPEMFTEAVLGRSIVLCMKNAKDNGTEHGPDNSRSVARAGKHKIPHVSGNKLNLRTIQSIDGETHDPSALTTYIARENRK